MSRIISIDLLRGLVILIMMVDHVRERFFMHTRVGDPIDETVSPELYFTRYLTHLCAPIFIFLAGLSAWLYAHPASGSYRSPANFLFKRGLVLILIEVVLYYLLWVDTIATTIWLQVLWAIGVSMIGLSLMCRLNYWIIGFVGFLIVFGHNALTPIEFAPDEFGYTIWSILHDQNNIGEVGGLTIRASYPVLPWFGVILLGYFAGPLFAHTVSSITRRKALIIMGLTSLLVLLVLRGFNLYGETSPWSVQATTVGTVMSFLNFTKYPPSLDYLLVTLGVGFFLLAWFDTFRDQNAALKVLEVYGSVPMFAYIVHLYALLAAYWVLYLFFGATHGDRFGLSSVGQIWIGAALLALILYFPSKAFANYKHREKHNRAWLSYF
ncbi:DUF1624 domain-containing protein [Exilibacterium tricleocarpae]|uniref:DUF1624 domain-containing protein n=2 Tax=Exilibacterium tricleocarpae TaxID=2591008 RepID=A0A545T8M7_9GAMM|nr:DUF1624 domain-containing protein [Exilibacterium tricleocarpae]